MPIIPGPFPIAALSHGLLADPDHAAVGDVRLDTVYGNTQYTGTLNVGTFPDQSIQVIASGAAEG